MVVIFARNGKGSFLEHTQRQRWTRGGWYAVCKHLLLDIDLRQYNMKNFQIAAEIIWGSSSRWALPDRNNFVRFICTVNEGSRDLQEYQLVKEQHECLIDFSKLSRPPRIAEMPYQKSGTKYTGAIPWNI